MKLRDGLVEFNENDCETVKLSEQAILAIVMIIQKVFLDVAQDKGDKSIEEYLEEADLVLQDGEIYIANPVSFSVDTSHDETLGEDDEADEDDFDDAVFESPMKYKN
jgi:hypothetical protein